MTEFEKSKENVKVLANLLRDRYMYDLASAIRGDDYEYLGIKNLFTSRIRYCMGITEVYATTIDIRTDEKIMQFEISDILYELKEMKAEKRKKHYFYHVLDALTTLRVLELMSQEEYNNLTALCDEMLSYISDYSEIKLDLIKERLNKMVSE